ncbi:hypothetical protein EUX98_g3538 [Antrodiella citrinella]|uniref:Uncharacterized protein n=1 Tax=Antrodiella citrinella TaxID=2447956 RepID=A0A4V3XIV8_9APHY|nr:hypothetical protein EUX98_g3538 [Antrodiella citrinella]
MPAQPFPTPRTPKKYKHIPQPASPLDKYSRPLPPRLPSLRPWKETCRNYSKATSSRTSICNGPSRTNAYDQRDTRVQVRFVNYPPELYEFYYMTDSEDDGSSSEPNAPPSVKRAGGKVEEESSGRN